jgi:pantoate--beta-alanine ligase
MLILTKAEMVNTTTANFKGKVSFIPTMGALHEGHLSLVEKGKELGDLTVCSIFVNPTQFNEATDLEKYPRMVSSDLRKLMDVGCDIVFLPSVDEIYPENVDTSVELDLQGLDNTMEGKHRPGHFEGVVHVVKRLLDIVGPDFLIMGQKDYQQFRIIEWMIEKLELPVKIIMGETKREHSGLAMSSRNARLSAEERKKASIIFEQLQWIVKSFGAYPVSVLTEKAWKTLEAAGLKPEYIELVDGESLLPVTQGQHHSRIVVAAAARLGQVRLIDNMIIRQNTIN